MFVEIKKSTFFTTVNNLCREWNSLFSMQRQLCDTCLKPQMGNISLFWMASVTNGGKWLLLLNVPNVNRILVKCLSHWTGCPHSQMHNRGNTTNPLGPYLGVIEIFVLLRLFCKEILQTNVHLKLPMLLVQWWQHTCMQSIFWMEKKDPFGLHMSSN